MLPLNHLPSVFLNWYAFNYSNLQHNVAPIAVLIDFLLHLNL